MDVDDGAVAALNEQVKLQHQSVAPVTIGKPLHHTNSIQVIFACTYESSHADAAIYLNGECKDVKGECKGDTSH